jgi:hypothetical protein
MDGDLIDVDPDAIRARASDLDRTALALAHGIGGPVPLTVYAPGWATADALASLAAAVDGAFGGLGVRVARSAALLRAAAGDYEQADDRAAGRLGHVG